MKKTSRARLRATGCALLAAAALPATVQADPNPYSLGASLSRSHDSNVYRLPDNQGPLGDSSTTVSLIGGLDQPIGRQRIYGDVSLRRQKFDNISELDNTGYDGELALDWESVNRLSGTLRAAAEQSLSASALYAPLRERNTRRHREFGASVQRGTGRNDVETFASFDAHTTSYSAQAYRFRDNDRQALRAGLRWHRSDLLTLGSALVLARGEYPHALNNGTIADDYRSRGIEFTGAWAPTGASRFNARLGWENRQFSSASGRDFKGLTGLLRWQWQPTGKLQFATSLLRQTADTERPLPAEPLELSSAGSRVTNTLLWEGTWNATAKIAVNASYRYADRKLSNVITGLADSRGSDVTRIATLGATWAPTRHLSLGCNVARENRSTDSTLSYAYKANTTGCYLQALLK